MLNTATTYLALLKEEKTEMKQIAIMKLEQLIDENWSEISDYIKTLDSLFESNETGQKETIALILSKLYFHLDEYEHAIEWALKAKEKFNYMDKNLYSSTILKKIIDKYISIKKHNFYPNENDNNDALLEVNESINEIIVKIFNKCLDTNEINQAIGLCIDSYDLARIAIVISKLSNKEEIVKTLAYITKLITSVINNKFYKSKLLQLMITLYKKHLPENVFEIVNCQYLLKDSESIANTLYEILIKPEEEPLTAYQIAFDLNDNQESFFSEQVSQKISDLYTENDNKNPDENISKINKERLKKITGILSGLVQKQVQEICLSKLNNTDPKILENLKKSVEKGGSVCQLGVILCNSLMNSHTKNDQFLKDNFDWVSKSTNWARYTATASLGVIHMGNTSKGMDIMQPYLPGGTNQSTYAQAGAYYGLGMIYANTNDAKVLSTLMEALSNPNNNKEDTQHMLQGIFFAIGLVTMGAGNTQLYERLRDGMYTDDAIAGEGATYAIGLSMLGTKDPQVIEDLIAYSHDTKHEKILRAIALSISLILYGAEEEGDETIEALSKEKEAILRYGAMYCVGMAYVGSANTKALQKLLRFAVSDVNDDVRRAAVTCIGFLNFKNPSLIIDNLKVLNLLSESYNPHIRYGVAMALGIACAGTSNIDAFNMIFPLLKDPSWLVRQGSIIACGMIFNQCTAKQEGKFKEFKDELNKITENKDEHVMIRYGGFISQGLLEVGGRNSVLSLLSQSGNNRVSSIVGVALFTQYYYWFPMAHMINLAVSPSMFIGLDSNLKIAKNYKVFSNAKPSLYGYPKEDKLSDKNKEEKVATAVLSTVTRISKKKSRLGTSNSLNTGNLTGNIDNNVNTASKSNTKNIEQIENIDNVKLENKDKDNIEIEKEKEIPEEDNEYLNNPCRILMKQRNVIELLPNQDYEQILTKRFNGCVLLKSLKDDLPEDYFGDEPIDLVPGDENKDKDGVNKDKDEKKDKNGYSAVPGNDENDDDMPEILDMNNMKKD